MSDEFKMQSPWQAGQDKLEASVEELEKRVLHLERSIDDIFACMFIVVGSVVLIVFFMRVFDIVWGP